jgi:transposase InsO family protein
LALQIKGTSHLPIWPQRFEDRDHAFRVIADWLDRYHTDRPHSALGYLTPNEYREKLAA